MISNLKFELLENILWCSIDKQYYYSISTQDDIEYPLCVEYGKIHRVPKQIGQAKHVEEAIKIAKKHYKERYTS